MRGLRYIKQKGLSLIEMMIAMSLGAIVSVGVIQLFTANSETYNLMIGQSRMQESARFALDFFTRSIQQAGYKGCFSEDESVFSRIADPDNVPYEFQIFRGLGGFDATLTNWNPVLTPLDTPFVTGTGIDTSAIINGTDVLTVRTASQNPAPLATDMLTSEEDVLVTIPTGGLEFATNDLVLLSDCEKNTVFRVTGMTVGSGLATLLHNTTDGFPANNSAARLAEVNTFETDASVAAIFTSTFFIAPGVGVNNAGDTPLSLWRKYGNAAPSELVEGVEDMQILFGVDSDQDGTPNQYLTANLVSDFREVKTVRVSLTLNSVDDVGATSEPTHGCIADGGLQTCLPGSSFDGLIRRTFHQTIQVRNKG